MGLPVVNLSDVTGHLWTCTGALSPESLVLGTMCYCESAVTWWGPLGGEHLFTPKCGWAVSSSLLRMERDSEEDCGARYLPPTASHNPEGNLEFDPPY